MACETNDLAFKKEGHYDLLLGMQLERGCKKRSGVWRLWHND
jgi:hypothetical protein